MNKMSILVLAIAITAVTAQSEEKGKHLFILSGQSNMTYMKPELSFTPAIEKAFGKENVIIVKDDKPARPISDWYKKWKSSQGNAPKSTGTLYDSLMKKVIPAIKDRKIATVTFIWMQGERDAKIKEGDVYKASIKGLVKQLSTDLKRDDLNVVIGRINDYSMNNKSHPHWTRVREAQMQAAKELPRAAWVDSDDLNGPKNGIHATKEGFVKLGERFAAAAIKLVKNPKSETRPAKPTSNATKKPAKSNTSK